MAHHAKTMAVDEINAAGGINGRMLELVVEDSKCSAQDAISAYNKLTDVDGVKIILGTTCSGAMLGVAPLAEADGVVLFSGLSSNPDIANAGDYIFRTQISDIEVAFAPATSSGRRHPRAGHHHRRDRLRRGCPPHVGRAVREERRSGHRRRALCTRHHRLPVTVDQAVQRQSGRPPYSPSIRVRGRHYRQAGTGVGLPGPDLRRDGHGWKHRAGDRGRRGNRGQGHLRRPDPNNAKAQDVLADFGERYDYITLPWHLGSPTTPSTSRRSASGKPTTTRTPTDSGTASTTSRGVAPSATTTASTPTARLWGYPGFVVEVLPPAERTKENYGYKVLGRGQAG